MADYELPDWAKGLDMTPIVKEFKDNDEIKNYLLNTLPNVELPSKMQEFHKNALNNAFNVIEPQKIIGFSQGFSTATDMEIANHLSEWRQALVSGYNPDGETKLRIGRVRFENFEELGLDKKGISLFHRGFYEDRKSVV